MKDNEHLAGLEKFGYKPPKTKNGNAEKSALPSLYKILSKKIPTFTLTGRL